MIRLGKKVFGVILNRFRNKIRPEKLEDQYEFVTGTGTANAMFLLKMMSDRTVEVQRDVFLSFIDKKKRSTP